MTPIERVRSTRRILSLGAVFQALGWGTATALALLALFSFATLADPRLAGGASWQMAVSLILGASVAFGMLWRVRGLTSLSRVALWIEERIPALHYSLVTALEPGKAPFREGVERTVAGESFAAITRRAVARGAGPAILAALMAGLLLYISPSAAFGGGRLFGTPSESARATAAGSRLDGLDIEIVPPSYARERSSRLDDPSSVTALVGSRIVIHGNGTADGITADAGGTRLRVANERRGWTATLAMPAKPAALTLRDGDFDRIIVLEPRPDNPPRIVLTSPERDST